jgi:RHS repeat-associated protein
MTQVVRAEEIVYFHNDLAGTAQVATNTAGTLIWREHFHPYGKRLDNPPASSANTVWFAGKPQDSLTGLSYMGARYYDPTLGRFLSIDPAAFDEQELHSLNRYAYANNNPIKFVDPDGRMPILIPVIFGITALFHSDPANTPVPGEVPQGPNGGAPLLALVPIGRFFIGRQTVIRETVEKVGEQVGKHAGAAAVGVPFRSIAGTRGLQHSFDKHASQWFGREVTRTADFKAWQSVLERAVGNSQQVAWSTGGQATVGHLAIIEGRPLFVQFFVGGPRAGELATAFVPTAKQLAAILEKLGK